MSSDFSVVRFASMTLVKARRGRRRSLSCNWTVGKARCALVFRYYMFKSRPEQRQAVRKRNGGHFFSIAPDCLF